MQANAALSKTQEKLQKAQAAFEQGKFARVREIAEKLLDKEDTAIDARLLLLKVHTKQGFPKRGLKYARELAEAFPENYGVQLLAGDTAYACEEYIEAMGYFGKALGANASDPKNWIKLAKSMFKSDAKKESIDLLIQAVDVFPDQYELFDLLSKTLEDVGESEQALEVCRKVAKRALNFEDLQIRYARLLYEHSLWNEHVAFADDLEDLESFFPQCRVYMAKGYLEEGYSDKAIDVLTLVDTQYPQNVEAKSMFVNVYMRRGQFELALKWAEKALSINPEHKPALWNQSLTYYYLGDFKKAFVNLEKRFEVEAGAGKRGSLTAPMWDGRALETETLLIWSDQGVGDIFKHLPMLDLALEKAQNVILEVPEKMIAPLRRLYPNIKIRKKFIDPKSSFLKIIPKCDYDYEISLASLQPLVMPTMEDIKQNAKTYMPDSEIVKKIRSLPLFQNNRPKVGIFWRSGRWKTSFRNFSPPIENIAHAYNFKNVDFISLQYNDVRDDIKLAEEQFGLKIHHLEDIDLFNDIEAALALTACLDLVVSTNSTVADMAGILGIKTLRYGAPGCMVHFGEDYVPWYVDQAYQAIGFDTPSDVLPEKINAWLAQELSQKQKSA